MQDKVKLHLGCGTVYLDGYTNYDIQLPNHYLAKDRPDLVRENITTVKKYYKTTVTRDDIENKRLHHKDVVVDKYSDGYRDLDLLPNSVDEIRLVQVFEHFTYEEQENLLRYWYRLLKKGGVLHIDVPDTDRTIRHYNSSNTQEDRMWNLRLLMGSQKNYYGIHKGMHNGTSLIEMAKASGFTSYEFKNNIHFYPCLAIDFIK